MLSPDIRHTIASHTANISIPERVIRVRGLLKRYRITDEKDRAEVARIAAVRVEEI